MINYAFCAVKHKNSDKVIDFVDEYLTGFKLHVVEERIGNRGGKYATATRNYPTLNIYDEKELIKDIQNRLTNEFQTAFSVYEPLPENSQWTVIYFMPYLAKRTTDINTNLAKFLSERLKTITLEYKEYSLVNQYLARKYQSGRLIDEVFISDGQVINAYGIFDDIYDYDDDESKLYKGMFKKLHTFFEINDYKFKDDAYDLSLIQRRPMYIKGHPEHIIAYLNQYAVI